MNLEQRTQRLENKFDNLQNEVHQGFSDLKASITKIAAKPSHSFMENLASLRDILILFGIIASAITYLASNVWTAEITSIKNQLQRNSEQSRRAVRMTTEMHKEFYRQTVYRKPLHKSDRAD